MSATRSLAKGHEVHALDDFSSGKRENFDPKVKLTRPTSVPRTRTS